MEFITQAQLPLSSSLHGPIKCRLSLEIGGLVENISLTRKETNTVGISIGVSIWVPVCRLVSDDAHWSLMKLPSRASHCALQEPSSDIVTRPRLWQYWFLGLLVWTSFNFLSIPQIPAWDPCDCCKFLCCLCLAAVFTHACHNCLSAHPGLGTPPPCWGFVSTTQGSRLLPCLMLSAQPDSSSGWSHHFWDTLARSCRHYTSNLHKVVREAKEMSSEHQVQSVAWKNYACNKGKAEPCPGLTPRAAPGAQAKRPSLARATSHCPGLGRPCQPSHINVHVELWW